MSRKALKEGNRHRRGNPRNCGPAQASLPCACTVRESRGRRSLREYSEVIHNNLRGKRQNNRRLLPSRHGDSPYSPLPRQTYTRHLSQRRSRLRRAASRSRRLSQRPSARNPLNRPGRFPPGARQRRLTTTRLIVYPRSPFVSSAHP